MSNAEYNEAQFEIEKAEAVKEARNAALEEAAVWVQKRCEDSESENLNYNAETIANWIRDFKTLAILLPLLFVFGVAAAEPVYVPRAGETAESAALGQSALSAAYEYRALKSKWTRQRSALSIEAREKLFSDLTEAQTRMNALTYAHVIARPPKTRP